MNDREVRQPRQWLEPPWEDQEEDVAPEEPDDDAEYERRYDK